MLISGINGVLPNGDKNSLVLGSLDRNCLIGKRDASNGFDNGEIVNNGKVSVLGAMYYGSSDERLKSIKGNVSIDLDKLSEVRKVFYTFLSDETNKVELGAIAQDIQKVCPEVVDIDENGYLSVAYDRLSVIALSTIETLYEKIKILEDVLDNE